MRILIDARLYGLEHAGIGRYVVNLVDQLQVIDKRNQYLLLVRKQTKNIQLPASNFQLQIVDIPHYSFQEQIELPKLLSELKPDLVHFPHFNVPIFWSRVPFVVTIHDLIKHASRGPATTTRNPFLYWLKYWGYQVVFGSAVKRAARIIVPSNSIKEELLKNYKISAQKVEIIYEGVDEIFRQTASSKQQAAILKKYKLKQPYVIYVGNAYPHKNLERLIQSIKYFNDMNHYSERLNLVMVSTRSVFSERLMRFMRQNKAEKFVKFLGFVPDKELVVLYKNAKAFLFPSLSEGFGLPGLEAMASGTVAICSDIPVFHEIYADSAIYFDPYDVRDIVEKVDQVVHFDDLNHRTIITKGQKQAKQFSWQKMAKETLEVYREVFESLKR